MRELNKVEVESVNGAGITEVLVGATIGAIAGHGAGVIARVAFGAAIGGPVGAAIGIVAGIGYGLATMNGGRYRKQYFPHSTR